MTGRDLIAAQLRLIGAKASGDSLTAEEATDGLASTNRMISSWSNEGLLIYAITAETPLSISAGDGTVTLGVSGDIATRPQSIEKALMRSGTTDYPLMRLITVDEYAAIPDKSTQGVPHSLYDDGGYPQRTLKLHPVPSSTLSLVLFTKRVITAIATLDTVLAFPPGYEDALVFNGAIRLAPEYGRAITPEIAQIAIDTKAAIKIMNRKPRYLQCDPAITGHGGFNIYTGDE